MTQEHVPRAEQNNHAIQERVQAVYYRFLLTHLPRILVEYLVMESTKKLGSFQTNMVCQSISVRA